MIFLDQAVQYHQPISDVTLCVVSLLGALLYPYFTAAMYKLTPKSKLNKCVIFSVF